MLRLINVSLNAGWRNLGRGSVSRRRQSGDSSRRTRGMEQRWRSGDGLDAREARVTPRGENAFCGYISFFGLRSVRARASSIILAMRRSRDSGER